MKKLIEKFKDKLWYAFAFYLLMGYWNFWLAMNIVNPYQNENENGKIIKLYDVGFVYLPEVSVWAVDASIILVYIYFIGKWLVFNDWRGRQILTRYFWLMGMVFWMRSLAFSFTLLPACYDDCRGRQTGEAWIWFDWSYDMGCVDHIFSGHGAHITLFWLYLERYSRIELEKWLIRSFYPIYLIMIIGSRLHYSVDVYLGVLVAGMTFKIWEG